MKTPSYRIKENQKEKNARSIKFIFNGKKYVGLEGDTLASALLANGVHFIARSFKYHRPRGIYSSGMEEPNALVQVGRGAASEPNLRATQVELYDGLEARSINCWPSLKFDFWSINNVFSGLLPAGFYYKTFMWPQKFWKYYERAIRNAAGLGVAPNTKDQNIYDKMHKHCDLLVVGAGPAGMSAALAAGKSGARVILVDEQAELGGSLLGTNQMIKSQKSVEWIQSLASQLEQYPEITVLSRTTAFGYYDHNYVLMVQRINDHCGGPTGTLRQRLWKVRAREVILATGAIERPMLFANNDRPGVMLAGAAQTYINRYAVRPGKEAIIYGDNDSIYQVAQDLTKSGVSVKAVIDARQNPPLDLIKGAIGQNIQTFKNYAIVKACGTRRIRGAVISEVCDSTNTFTGKTTYIKCDLICVSGGWTPSVHLFSQSGGQLTYDGANKCFIPGVATQNINVVGSANGVFRIDDCLADGSFKGEGVSVKLGFCKDIIAAPPEKHTGEKPGGKNKKPYIFPLLKGKKYFVDLHNDVTISDIGLAEREGYRSIEHLKRYTTVGMGPDQGRTGNMLALNILSHILGKSVPELGTTTFRPPYTPVPYGVMAGRDVGLLADPIRTTPIHSWHVQSGAVFEDIGSWKRPWFYPRAEETMEEAVKRECSAARDSLAIFDASTLGKIDIKGPDSAQFLNLIYTNNWDNLKIGRCRYGLMLGEDGMVMDDGVTTRLAEHHYFMTTTTGGAARVMAWLEDWLQCEWPHLQVYLTSVTEQWSTISISGPNSRQLVKELAGDIELSSSAFPHMAMRECHINGMKARICRVSFTGELGFEISVGAGYGLALWQMCITLGATYGMTPIGTEALHVLRAEKGYIAVGHDTDGSVTPIDLGMNWIVSSKKDFLGRRSLLRSDSARPDRKQLVGLLPESMVPEGAQIVENLRPKPPMDMIGHITSSYYSTALEKPIALALVRSGRDKMGQDIYIPLLQENRLVRAKIVSPVFYDPEGERLNA